MLWSKHWILDIKKTTWLSKTRFRTGVSVSLGKAVHRSNVKGTGVGLEWGGALPHFTSHGHHALGKLEVTVSQYLKRIQKIFLHFGRVHGGQLHTEGTEMSFRSTLPGPKSVKVNYKVYTTFFQLVTNSLNILTSTVMWLVLNTN